MRSIRIEGRSIRGYAGSSPLGGGPDDGEYVLLSDLVTHEDVAVLREVASALEIAAGSARKRGDESQLVANRPMRLRAFADRIEALLPPRAKISGIAEHAKGGTPTTVIPAEDIFVDDDE